MSECSDRRFQDKLMAYELGVLSDQERQELELHLLQCEDCFREVRNFQPAARLMRNNRELQRKFAAMLSDSTVAEQEITPRVSAKTSRWRVPASWFPLSLTAAVVLIVLILRPWKLEIGPSNEAIAFEDRLAVIPFENLAEPGDPQRLGHIAANLLITDLGESGYLRVISTPQLYTTLQRLGVERDEPIDSRTAVEVANRTRSRWLLTGSILQEGTRRALAVQVSDVITGDVVVALRLPGETQDDIFSLIDLLTSKLEDYLPLPREALSETNPNVANVTTSSPEAFRHYLDGIEYSAKLYSSEARSSFEQAISIDSTFAMAHYYLATLGLTDEIEKAVKYINNAGHRDRYFIRSRAAWIAGDAESAIKELIEAERKYSDEAIIPYTLGTYEYSRGQVAVAIDYWRKTLAVDPQYKEALNQLVYAYQGLGDFEQAILAVEKYISLAPGEANPYDTKGDLYAANGDIEKAADCYRVALTLKPDLEISREKLAYMLVYGEDYEAADSCFRQLTDSNNPDTRSLARFSLAFSPLAQGQFTRCLEILGQAIAADSLAFGEERCPSNRLLKALVLYEVGKLDQAAAEVQKAGAVFARVMPGGRPGYRHFLAQFLAESGQLGRARTLATELRVDRDSSDQSLSEYWYAIGCIELAEGSSTTAIEALKQASVSNSESTFAARFQLARALLEAGQHGEAAQELQNLVSDYSARRLFFGAWNVKIHYYLGRAYEQSGWDKSAIEQYQRFLHLWRKADEGIGAVDDARKRVERLRS